MKDNQALRGLLFVLKEFVYGGHLLSLGASAIVWVTCRLLDVQFTIQLFFVPYLLSQVIYTYNHFKEQEFDEESNPERTAYLARLKKIEKNLLLFYLMVLLIFSFFTNIPTFVFILFFTIGGMLYTDYFKTLTEKKIIAFKNFYTAFFWALIIFLVLFFHSNYQYSFFLLFFFFVFLRLVVNTAFFDIKDVSSDKKRGLKTFPTIFGKKGALFILQIINLFSLIFAIAITYFYKFPSEVLGIGLLGFFYGFLYITVTYFLKEKEIRQLSYVVVDGEYLFWPFFLILGEFLFS